MRIKKRVQQLEERLARCEKKLFPPKSNVSSSYKKDKKKIYTHTFSSSDNSACKVCGKLLPSSRIVYCSAKCAEIGRKEIDKQWHKKSYKKKISKKTWVPSKKEMKMFQEGKLTAAQWKKHFGLQTYTGVYKKLGQLAMYKG